VEVADLVTIAVAVREAQEVALGITVAVAPHSLGKHKLSVVQFTLAVHTLIADLVVAALQTAPVVQVVEQLPVVEQMLPEVLVTHGLPPVIHMVVAVEQLVILAE
jgi:hypothetical protein